MRAATGATILLLIGLALAPARCRAESGGEVAARRAEESAVRAEAAAARAEAAAARVEAAAARLEDTVARLDAMLDAAERREAGRGRGRR